MPGDAPAKVKKPIKRSEEAMARRRRVQRQKQSSAREACASLRRELELLEDRALGERQEWARAEDSKLSDGLAKPELCTWGVVHGPRTERQAELHSVLLDAVEEVRTSPVGKFLAEWLKLSREEQGTYSDTWPEVKEVVDAAAFRMRSRWCRILGCSAREALCGSPLRVPLLNALMKTWRAGAQEDESVLQEVDVGVNIGVREAISRSHMWPDYSGANSSEYYSVSSFEKDAFINYQTAEQNPGRVECELEAAVRKGHMVKVGDTIPQEHKNAIVSRVAAIPKVSGSWRIIDDMKRSGLNSLVKAKGHILETICLPTLRAVALLLWLALSWFSSDAVIIELDAAEAFKHLRVSVLDEEFMYNCAPGSKTLYRHLRLAFGCISSPLWWVRAFSCINRILCVALQVKCIAYIDDTSFISNRSSAFEHFVSIILFYSAAGVLSELRKARVSPSPRLLGFQCHLANQQIDIPADKLAGIVELGEGILASYLHKEAVSVSSVETLLGKLMWASQTGVSFRCHLSPIFAWCKAVKKRRRKSQKGNSWKSDSHRSAYLGHAAYSKIKLLLTVIQCDWLRARSITSVLGRGTLGGEVVCISDASLEGFGGTCSVLIPGGECRRLWFAVSFGDASISSPVKQLVNPFRQSEYYTSDDIGPLELLGVIVGLLVIPKNDRRLSCTILCDNQSAVSAVNKSYSSVDRMASLLARLAAVKPGDRRLRAFHLPGSCNRICDDLSRGRAPRACTSKALGVRIDVRPVIELLAAVKLSGLGPFLVEESSS